MGLPDRQQGLFILFVYGIIYAVSARAATNQVLRRIVITVGAVTLLECAYCVLQARGTSLFTYYSGIPERVFGTTGNPVFLGSYLSLVIPVLIAGALSELRERRVVLFALLAAAVVSAAYFLVESGSRGAFLGCVVGVVSLAYLVSRVELRTTPLSRVHNATGLVGALAILGIIAVLAVFVMVSGPTNPLSRIVSTFQGKEPSALNRLETARSSVQMIADRPLVGYGMEQMFFFFPSYQSTESVRLEGSQTTADRAHNEYLQLAIDSGMPGFLAGVALLIYLFLRSGHAAIRGGLLDRGAFAGLLSYAVQALFGITHLAVFPTFLVLAGQLANWRAPEASRTVPAHSFSRFSRLPRIIAAISVFGMCLVVGVADIYARQANIAYARGGFVNAVDIYEKAVAVNPSAMKYAVDADDTILLRLVPISGIDQTSYLERAIAIADVHLAANPRSFTVLTIRASANFKLYQQTQKREFLSRAFEDAALAQSIAPFYPPVYYVLVNIYRISGNIETALSLSQRLVELDSSSPQAYFLLAQTLTHAGRYQEASQAMQRGKELERNR